MMAISVVTAVVVSNFNSKDAISEPSFDAILINNAKPDDLAQNWLNVSKGVRDGKEVSIKQVYEQFGKPNEIFEAKSNNPILKYNVGENGFVVFVNRGEITEIAIIPASINLNEWGNRNQRRTD